MQLHSADILKYFGITLLAACLITAWPIFLYAQDSQPKEVLVLHSYHHGLSWDDAIDRGIESIFKKSYPDIETQFEYMDTKRINDPAYLGQLYGIYKHKFRNRKFDVIVSSDNNAFNFLLEHRDELFPQTPVVFCGVNNFKDAMLKDRSLYTGTVEAFDIRGTLDIALKLHPKTKHFVVYGDNSPTYLANKEILERIIPDYESSVDFIFKDNFNIREIRENILKLPSNSLILLISTIRDEQGQLISFERSAEMMAAVSSAPIYGCWNFFLGHGIVGGKLISGFAQGKTAAQMALRILNGEKIKNVPVLKESPNRYMFDYNELKRFGIKLAELPKGSILINKPYSFYSEYKGLILSALGTFACLILIILVLVTNIFRRKQAEELFRKLFERSPVGLFIVQDRKFQLLNSQFLRLTGYSEDDFLGVDSLAFVLPEDRDMVNENTIKMLKEGFSFPFEFRVINKSGEIRWIELTITSIQYQQRRAVLGYYVDITESKQAREEIAKQHKYMESVVHSAPDAIVTLDASHNIIEWNAGAERIFGYNRDEVVGKDIDDLISLPDMKHELKALTKQLLSREKLLSHETVRYKKDGTPVNVIVSGSPILIEGELHGVVAVYTDITEKKKLESQLAQAQKMESIGTLSGGIAHDFNNILAAIIGFAELAKMRVPEDSEILPNLDQILKSGNRAKTLIQQILAFSRKQELEQKPLQLKYIVKEILKLLRSTLPSDIEIKEDIAKDAGVVNADPTQMQQVIMNLCTNAGHAMQEEGGVLAVGLTNVELDDVAAAQYLGMSPGRYLRLSVSDTGYGMTSDVKERIFEPYFTTKEKGVGTGLGLSVVNGIIDSHGGTITVYSEPGKGSTFHVYLPLIQEEAIKPEMDEQAPILTGNERILFIDDEKALVDLGKQMLKHFGYEVTSRTSSIEALELFRTKPDQFDLVITDMTMPKMTGDKLAKELMKIRPDIPIIICTGFSERISEEKAKGMGIKAFAMKPLVMRDMARTVRKVLD